MSRQPKLRFSVVIPCFDEEDYIGDTLYSLKQQTFKEPYEIIVVDNNSTDSSVEIAKIYGARIVTEKQSGVCFAREAGTKAARGEIIVSTDADTIFAPDWLDKIHQSFNQSTGVIAVSGPCSYRSGPYWVRVYPKILFGASNAYAKMFNHPFYITATNIAFKKSAWQGYDLHAPQGGDEFGLLRLLKKKGKIVFDYNNPVFTSARRLKRGFVYNIFVTLFYYYLLGYFLDRIFGRAVIGQAPAYRFKIDQEAISKRAQKFANKFLLNKAGD